MFVQPFGDVDDRVRAIAHQMGMRTILWDQDSFDWQIGPTLPQTTVDERYKKWIADRTVKQDNLNGHITLQHELNADTVKMAMKWLPDVVKNFNVMPIHQCMDDTSPYWETSFVYPKRDGSLPLQATNKANPSYPSASTPKAGQDPSIQFSGSSVLQRTLLPCVTVAALIYRLFM